MKKPIIITLSIIILLVLSFVITSLIYVKTRSSVFNSFSPESLLFTYGCKLSGKHTNSTNGHGILTCNEFNPSTIETERKCQTATCPVGCEFEVEMEGGKKVTQCRIDDMILSPEQMQKLR